MRILTAGSLAALVRKGNTLVQITVRSPELAVPAAVKAAVLDIGRAVLGRL